jgi:hypothetical protein
MYGLSNESLETTMSKHTNKPARPGRKPEFGNRALTNSEKVQRAEMKKTLLRKAMKERGYVPVETFIHPAHLKFLSLLDLRCGGHGDAHRDPAKLSQWLWRLIRLYAKDLELKDGPVDTAIKELIEGDQWPEFTFHEIAEMTGQDYLREWTADRMKKDVLKVSHDGGINIDPDKVRVEFGDPDEVLKNAGPYAISVTFPDECDEDKGDNDDQ